MEKHIHKLIHINTKKKKKKKSDKNSERKIVQSHYLTWPVHFCYWYKINAFLFSISQSNPKIQHVVSKLFVNEISKKRKKKKF